MNNELPQGAASFKLNLPMVLIEKLFVVLVFLGACNIVIGKNGLLITTKHVRFLRKGRLMKLLSTLVLILTFVAGCSSIQKPDGPLAQARVPASETGINAVGSYYIERQRTFEDKWSFCAIDQDQNSIVINKDTRGAGQGYQRIEIKDDAALAKLAKLKTLTLKMLPSLKASAGHYTSTNDRIKKYNSYTLMVSEDTGYLVADFWTLLPTGTIHLVKTCDSQTAVQLVDDLCDSVRPTPNEEPELMPQGLCH